MRLVNKIDEGHIKKVFLSEARVEVTRANGEVYIYGRREGPEIPGDELDEFAKLCRSKWCKGRKEYEGQGIPVYQADTIQEAQNELLDFSNFAAILYWEMERIRLKFNYKPERRKG